MVLRNRRGGVHRLNLLQGGLLGRTVVRDTEAPTKPGLMSASAITETTLTLTWGASTDDTAVLNYRVERAVGAGAFAWLATVAAPTVTLDVTGLTAATAYRFRVLAEDATGNVSAWEPDADGLSVTTATPFSFAAVSFSSAPYAMESDGAGGYYFVGAFTSVTDSVATYSTGYERFVHVGADGLVNPDFSCPLDVVAYAVVRTPQGILVGGRMTSAGGVSVSKIALVTPFDDALPGVATPWQAAAITSHIYGLLVDEVDDHVYIYGTAGTVGGVSRGALVRFTLSTATVDAAYTATSLSTVYCVAKDGDRLYVAGSTAMKSGDTFAAASAAVANPLVRFDIAGNAGAGALDTGWYPDVNTTMYSVVVDPVSRDVYIPYGSIGGDPASANPAVWLSGSVARLSGSTAVVDTAWKPRFYVTSSGARSIVLDLDEGWVYAAGGMKNQTGLPYSVVRYPIIPNGSITLEDSSFSVTTSAILAGTGYGNNGIILDKANRRAIVLFGLATLATGTSVESAGAYMCVADIGVVP